MSAVMQQAPSGALATTVINPATVFAPGGVRALVAKIQTDARAAAATLDISTEKGRKAIASLALKVARSKTAIDDAGKDLNAAKRAEIEVVDADRRFARETLDALKAEVRKDLTAWENADNARVAAHEAALAEIEGMVRGLPPNASTDHISGLIATLKTNQPRDWQEFTVRAERATAETVTGLQAAWDAAFQREADAAAEKQRKAEETERKRQEAIRAQKEREERIAAEAKAKAEKAAEAKAEKAQQAAAAALAKAQQEIDNAKAAAAQAQADAVAAERQRLADEAEKERREAQQRADNETHCKAVNSAAAEALIVAGLSRGAALTAVNAIAAGSIPHVVIQY